MESIPARPDTFFRVSPAEPGKAQGFAIKRGDVEGVSLGANFYAPGVRQYLSRLGSNPATLQPLSAYVDLNPPLDISGLAAGDLVGFIPMPSVSDNATGEYVAMDRPLGEVRKGYTPFANGDILWAKITPSMQNGKSCIVDGLTNGVGFGSTEFHVIRVREPGVSAKFVLEFISQDSIREIATYSFAGSAGQQRVPSTFLQNLPFPALSWDLQQELIAVMDLARAERKAKLDEADALLAGLNDFVLEALELEFPERDPRQVFAVRHRDVKQRIDSHFHSPEFAQVQRALSYTSCQRLGSITTLSKETWRLQEHDQETFRYIEIATVKPNTGEAFWNEVPKSEAPSRARMQVRAGDLIVSLTRPHHGSIAHLGPEFEGCVASTGFAVIRGVAAHVDRDYLWCVLRTQICLLQMLQRSSGGNYPAITESELQNIMVPIPNDNIQKRIASEAVRRLNEARRLCTDAEEGWKVAKQWFEEQLVGSVSL